MNKPLKTCKRLLKPFAYLCLGASSGGAALASEFNYIQVHGMQASYGDISGFDLRGGFGWEAFFTELRYRNLEDTAGDNKLEDERWNVSLGYSMSVSQNIRVDVRANYGSIELVGTSPAGCFISKPKYQGLSSYIHYDYSRDVRLYGGLEWQNLPDNADQKAYHLGAMYQFEAVAIGAEYTKYSDTDAISLFARYQF